MKKPFSSSVLKIALVLVVVSSLQSCIYINTRDNDIPPRGVATRDLNLNNFDQLAMGSAYSIRVKKGENFSIKATGELNDLDDLDASVSRSGVLEIKYRNTWRKSRDRMDIDIVMPSLRGVDFSGASVSTIEGFENERTLDYRLSGASKSTFIGSADRLGIDLSGASELTLNGRSGLIIGEISGASQLYAFDFPVDEADLNLSGASRARVRVVKFLKVDASGASNVRYLGNPTVEQRLSGSSSVARE
ncbi:head GIN domain-containing protein [Persicitalea jodogahamensis]|uniref:head GIN domain-containing protein n=1 Tax=Persicitalea jodogahamensis TaxID=402147 RepID=UPI001672A31C|nr:head GIN domain-containing protein [Persicitalea jodogahamensis]